MLTLRLRRRLSLTALTALFLFFSPLLTGNALAAFISVSPTDGPPGTLVIVRGSEWPAKKLIKLFWNFNDPPVPIVPPVATPTPALTPTPVEIASVRTDPSGAFTTTVVVTQSTLFTGLTYINARNEAGELIWQEPYTVRDETEPTGCVDAYFIGMHGTGEGPDGPNQMVSRVIGETWENFHNLATGAGKNVRGYAIDYLGAAWQLPTLAVTDGSFKLDERVYKIVINSVINSQINGCLTPSIVLEGYSLGAWVINEWLSQHPERWTDIGAVELYGDPLWYRTDTIDTYRGVARVVGDLATGAELLRPGLLQRVAGVVGDLTGWLGTLPYPDPYANNPPGPGVGLSDRWRSWCLGNDPVCGEAYGLADAGRQLGRFVDCAFPSKPCEHKKYTKVDGANNKIDGGYNLTEGGATFLFSKAFPELLPVVTPSPTDRGIAR